MKIKIFNERTELVHVTTHNVLHNLLVGMGLVIAILFIFLGDLASAGIVAIMIPLALLFSITVLYVQGKSANLLSIGAVDFGIIVDSSTIIVENIYRHITAPGVDRSRPLIDRIIDASSEIERALFYLDDDHRLRLHPAVLDVRSRGRPLRSDGQHLRLRHLRRPLDGGDAGTGPLLVLLREQEGSARHDARQDHEAPLPAGLELGLAAPDHRRSRSWSALFVYTLFLIPHLGGEFMPPLEEGYLWIRAILPRTVSLESAAKMAPQMREVVASVPEVSRVISQLGRPDDGTDVTGFFNLEIGAPLKPMEEWRKKPFILFGYKLWDQTISREDIEKELMEKFKQFPGINFNFSQYIRDNVEEALSGVKGANSVKIIGTDLHTLEEPRPARRQYLEECAGDRERRRVPHRRPAQPRDRDRSPALRPPRRQRGRRRESRAGGHRRRGLHPDGRGREALRHHAPAAARPARRSRGDQPDPGRRARCLGRQPGLPDSALAVDPHGRPQGRGIVRLPREQPPLHPDQVQRPRPRPGLRHRRSHAEGRTTPRPASLCPTGYDLEWSGEFEQMKEANDRLMYIIPLSLGLIMMLLYSMFNSVKDCLLVMVNVLEAAMGGVFALYFTGTHFSISGAVGFVSVFGVAVQDGVLLVTYCNQMRARGYSVWETCLRGPELRVRPVVMTSLTAALGLFPAAIATSIGSQAQKPLAIVVVGAMLCTLFLTRYMMPILYSYFPAPRGHVEGEDQHLVEGTNYAARFMHDFPEDH